MQNIRGSSSQFTPVVNPEALLRKIDKDVFDIYRNGAQLNVWRNSSPHNWWLSKPGERDEIYYHWPEKSRPSEAYTAFATRIGRNGEKVSYGSRGMFGFGADAGLSVQDSWVYDEAVYLACIERWASALKCAEQFNALAGSLDFDGYSLDATEALLLRGLKRGNQYPMLPQFVAAYEKLCAMSLAEVTPQGYLRASLTLGYVKVPSASTLSKAQAN